MARKPGPGKCAHCLKYAQYRNWDHVLPKAWYPDTTPQNIAKWQIPTCKECNEAYGRIEEDLLIRLALCLDPDAPESAGIVDRALRSIDPTQGRNLRDQRLRQARRTRILKQMMQGSEAPAKAIYPNFGGSSELPLCEQAAIKIPAESIRRLAQKIVRGIVYIEDGLFIEQPFSIDFYALTDDGAKPIIDIIDRLGQSYTCGLGIIVKRVVVPEDGLTSFYSIAIFGRFNLYACVSNDG